MDYEFVKPTKIIDKKDVYEENANVPDEVRVYECFCGKGTIEYHNVPGFNDSFFCIECPHCEENYRYIEWSGYEWKVYK